MWWFGFAVNCGWFALIGLCSVFWFDLLSDCCGLCISGGLLVFSCCVGGL